MKNIKITITILFLILQSCSYLPETLPLEDGLKISETRELIRLEPENSSGTSPVGFLFYPGGLVDPHAYMDWAADFALSGPGHLVLIVKMPANLAVLDANAARDIISGEQLREWVIGGHSLGGAMACSMVNKETDMFKALVLMGAYASSSTDLSEWSGEVLSITADHDLVLDRDNYEAGLKRLPSQSQHLVIEGGNHAGFGSYGPQKGDGEAEITVEEQHALLVEALQNFYTAHGFD